MCLVGVFNVGLCTIAAAAAAVITFLEGLVVILRFLSLFFCWNFLASFCVFLGSQKFFRLVSKSCVRCWCVFVCVSGS